MSVEIYIVGPDPSTSERKTGVQQLCERLPRRVEELLRPGVRADKVGCRFLKGERQVAVHVFLEPDEPAGYYIEEIIQGTTIVQALASVQYDENELKRLMKAQIDEAIKSDRMKPTEGMRLLDDYERGLKGYTYLSI